jgi:DNA-binding NarL/FixJ family response regulator
MMPKALYRMVVLLLVPCLLVAEAPTPSLPISQASELAPRVSVFNSQALAAPALMVNPVSAEPASSVRREAESTLLLPAVDVSPYASKVSKEDFEALISGDVSAATGSRQRLEASGYLVYPVPWENPAHSSHIDNVSDAAERFVQENNIVLTGSSDSESSAYLIGLSVRELAANFWVQANSAGVIFLRQVKASTGQSMIELIAWDEGGGMPSNELEKWRSQFERNGGEQILSGHGRGLDMIAGFAYETGGGSLLVESDGKAYLSEKSGLTGPFVSPITQGTRITARFQVAPNALSNSLPEPVQQRQALPIQTMGWRTRGSSFEIPLNGVGVNSTTIKKIDDGELCLGVQTTQLNSLTYYLKYPWMYRAHPNSRLIPLSEARLSAGFPVNATFAVNKDMSKEIIVIAPESDVFQEYTVLVLNEGTPLYYDPIRHRSDGRPDIERTLARALKSHRINFDQLRGPLMAHGYTTLRIEIREHDLPEEIFLDLSTRQVTLVLNQAFVNNPDQFFAQMSKGIANLLLMDPRDKTSRFLGQLGEEFSMVPWILSCVSVMGIEMLVQAVRSMEFGENQPFTYWLRYLAYRLSISEQKPKTFLEQASWLDNLDVFNLPKEVTSYARENLSLKVASWLYNEDKTQRIAMPLQPAESEGKSMGVKLTPKLDAMHLTKAEKEVLILVAQGWSEQEIASQRRSSFETVKSQMAEIRRKIRIKYSQIPGRKGFTVEIYQQGLVEAPPLLVEAVDRVVSTPDFADRGLLSAFKKWARSISELSEYTELPEDIVKRTLNRLRPYFLQPPFSELPEFRMDFWLAAAICKITAAEVPPFRPNGIRRGIKLTTKLKNAGLEKAESEVLSLVARGWKDKEIANHRQRSVKTVNDQMVEIRQKLGINFYEIPYRTGFLIELYRRGFVEVPRALVGAIHQLVTPPGFNDRGFFSAIQNGARTLQEIADYTHLPERNVQMAISRMKPRFRQPSLLKFPDFHINFWLAAAILQATDSSINGHQIYRAA